MNYVNKARIGRLIALGKSNAVRSGRSRPILLQSQGSDRHSQSDKPRLVAQSTGFRLSDDLVTA